MKYPTPTHDPLPGSQEGCKRTLDWPRRGLREGGYHIYIYIYIYAHPPPPHDRPLSKKGKGGVRPHA